MPELALFTWTTGDLASRLCAFVRLNETSVRWFRTLLARAQKLADEDSRFGQLTYVFPEGFFIQNPGIPLAEGYETLFDDLERHHELLLCSRPISPRRLLTSQTQIHVKPGWFYWESLVRFGHTSRHVHESTIALAWCLLCPEVERAEAFADLLQMQPHQALDWLEAGEMFSHDRAVRVPLPPLSADLLVPLFEHSDPAVRERAITVIGDRLPPSVRRSGFVR